VDTARLRTVNLPYTVDAAARFYWMVRTIGRAPAKGAGPPVGRSCDHPLRGGEEAKTTPSAGRLRRCLGAVELLRPIDLATVRVGEHRQAGERHHPKQEEDGRVRPRPLRARHRRRRRCVIPRYCDHDLRTRDML